MAGPSGPITGVGVTAATAVGIMAAAAGVVGDETEVAVGILRAVFSSSLSSKRSIAGGDSVCKKCSRVGGTNGKESGCVCWWYWLPLPFAELLVVVVVVQFGCRRYGAANGERSMSLSVVAGESNDG